MIKIAIIGCNGRMGKNLLSQVILNPNTSLSGGFVRKNSEYENIDLGIIAGEKPIGIKASSDIASIINDCDALIDFSTPQLSLEITKLAANDRKTSIIGTTGFSDQQFLELKDYAKQIPIIWSANMSIGVNILQQLTTKLSEMLDDSYDIEILEMHHHNKVDAPSGTAILLGQAAAKGRKLDLNKVACKERNGLIGKRKKGEIGFATLRGGDVIGEHSVIFACNGERIELTHKASNRNIFASGALRAAIWAKNQPAGFYTMQDVLATK